uniref:DNA repair and recombination protein RAD54-like n=1 Tax=Angiostrongylus cantonensis TaxID=6313 RepID=A0A158PBR6_ANGCA
MSKMSLSTPPVIHGQFRSPLANSTSPGDGSKRKRRKPIRLNPFNSDREDVIDPQRLKLIDRNGMVERDAVEHEKAIARILSRPFTIPLSGYCLSGRVLGMARSRIRVAMFDPYAENAVVLYTPPPLSAHDHMSIKEDDRKVHVVVDPVVGNILRPHQREGVQFMYNCVTGRNIEGYYGCIMADEMGLGKTLQCITLLYTLLQQSPEGKPTLSKVVIVCPSSLVKNWDKEIKKWLGHRISALPMDSGAKQEITSKLTAYMTDGRIRAATPVLIISYETFRLYAKILHSSEIGMGHRLKNNDNLTYQALNGLQCCRRVLISGTPIQNDLLEYYSLVNFVNPGLFGSANEFRKRFENPILRGRDGKATEDEQKKGEETTREMVALVERCIIRRTSTLLTNYLPVKYEHIICCRNTDVQNLIYNKIIESEEINRTTEKEKENGATASALSFITRLKKLCNHPYLIYDELQKTGKSYDGCLDQISDIFSKKFDPSISGKMKVLDYILAVTRKTCSDKFVLVSNYTQTIDQFVELCKLRGYGYVRLDGSMSIKQRSKIVEKFNDPESNEFCFLLSSKAGGCGLNLIGANRLVMFDPDWNPANDDQAMARTGSIEEKMFQRQTHKKALSSCVVDAGQDVARHFSSDQLKELFKLEADAASDTHIKLKCKRCINGIESTDPPETADCTSDLALWYHSQKDARKVIADPILRSVFSCGAISFVFHQKSHNVKVSRRSDDADDDEYEPSAGED